MSIDASLRARFDELVSAHKVVLFMKGTRRAPACGFSAQVVSILDEHLSSYETVDVLASPEIREGIKEYSEWPTLPQLYVDGKFVGGSDIVRELDTTGELARLLGADAAPALPTITISDAAARAFKDARESEQDPLRFEIDSRWSYGLFFGPREKGDLEVTANGVTLLMDRATARRAEGVSIDFVQGPEGGGFKIESPNEPAKVKQLSPVELKAMMDRGDKLELYDVRTAKEREIATIPGAKWLDADAQQAIAALPRETPLVFHCHHGGRSQAAAEHFLGMGFKSVYNVRGGIDGWSIAVDPKVPRY
jgi:monothiol glutaredoxin